jgi:hypothetical protein
MPEQLSAPPDPQSQQSSPQKPKSKRDWKGPIAACRQQRKELLDTWQDNVAYRRGKPFKTTPPQDTVNVPQDWSRTKNKISQVFYQVPEVKLKARRPEFASAAVVFAAALNFQLSHKVKAYHMMNEVLGDVINAAGIGICKVGYEATFEKKEVPLLDQTQYPPELWAQLEASGSMPTSEVEQAVYECYYARRVSPAHFLWPVEFTGSDWQEASWLGWEGYLSLAEAQRRGWVGEEFEGEEISDSEWLLVKEFDGQAKSADPYVKYCEIFYRASAYDSSEKDHRKIKRLVIIDKLDGDGIVVDEDFKWQRYVPENRQWIGMTSFPLKVLTLTNISDMAIPPSDSEMGRPQVRELIRGRSTMLKQRETSLPLRWFDVNQVDDEIADKLRRGKWQDMIPMNGPGDKAIGEVARAQFPRETFEFDRIAKADLDEAWSMGAPQQAAPEPGDTTATEVKAMQTALNVRLDYERSWVLRFFLEVAESVGGLMQLFSDDSDWVEIVGEDGVAALQPWTKDLIRGDYVFEAKPDSALKIDVSQKRAESLNLYKLLRKDPLINPVALVQEVLELHGIDPNKVKAPQQPPQPPPPKLSFSFKGEDLISPIAVAIIQQGPKPLSAEDIAAAKMLIEDAAGLMPPQPPQGDGGGGQGGAPAPTGENPPHPGPADVVQPLNRRYNEQGDTGPEGSRDST